MDRGDLLSLLREERGVLRQYGFGAMLEDSLMRVTQRALGSGYRTKAVPRLRDLYGSAQSVYMCPREVATEWIFEGDDGSLQVVSEEYAHLRDELHRRAAERPLSYPAIFGMQEDASFVLYALVRRLCPENVLETGVADGVSTFFILKAMLLNGRGTLQSIDIRADVGGLLDDAERGLWQYHQLHLEHLRRDFAAVIEELPLIDIYLHDSDHTYRWQRFEHETVLGAMASDGIIVSDDADASYAFLDVCREQQLHPVYLVGKRKVLGMARVQGSELS